MTKAQRNIRHDEHTGAWIVEYRPADADAAYDTNRGWVRVYEGGDESEARRAYRALGGSQ